MSLRSVGSHQESPRGASSRGVHTTTTAALTADNSDFTDVNAEDRSDAGERIEVDWYGNTALHHAFASNEVDIKKVEKLLSDCPRLASKRNQFGRIPLHYALDRIRVHLPDLRLLLKYYPDGVTVEDMDNMTPYDVARKWKHSSTIKKLLLDLAPSLDRNTHLLLKYGPLAKLAIWATSMSKIEPSPTNSTDYKKAYWDEDEDYVSGNDDSDDDAKDNEDPSETMSVKQVTDVEDIADVSSFKSRHESGKDALLEYSSHSAYEKKY